MKDKIGVILIADGQPVQWDETYPLTEEETTFLNGIKAKLTKEGFSERLILNAWIEERDASILEAFNDLKESKCRSIIAVSATTPIDCLDSLVEVTSVIEKPAQAEDIELITVGAWNDDQEIINIYLGLIASANELPLEELGTDATIVLQSTTAGAKLSNSKEEITEETESEASEDEE